MLFQNRRKATVFCFGAWKLSRRNNGFFISRWAAILSIYKLWKNYRSIFISLNLVFTLLGRMLLSIQLYKKSNCGCV